MEKINTQDTHSKLIHADQVIFASNRGLFEHYIQPDHTLSQRQSAGGMVTALAEVAAIMNATWIAMTITEGDRLFLKMAQQRGDNAQDYANNQTMRLKYVTVPEETFRKHYEIISTELLWFTQYYMHHVVDGLRSSQEISDAWGNGYYAVNQAIADAVCAEIAAKVGTSVVMLQDAFLCLAASMIRKRYASVVIQQFIHWPWPEGRYWCLLPSFITKDIYRGLLGNDIVGFQTEHDVHSFLDGVRTIVDEASLDFQASEVWLHGHRTLVRAYPISISVAEERNIVGSAAGKRETKNIEPFLEKKIIMRVDRIDPVKNILPGFQAYAQLLDEHPEFLNEVTFLAFLVPTRETVPLYQRYKAEVHQIIDEINQKYGSNAWTPIHAFYGNDRTRALVALQFYDVLLVNPMIDGMNLVAKEGATLNQRNGVLVLSRTAGTFAELREASIPISPKSQAETAHALYQALVLPLAERREMAAQARKIVELHTLQDWITHQIHDINELLAQ